MTPTALTPSDSQRAGELARGIARELRAAFYRNTPDFASVERRAAKDIAAVILDEGSRERAAGRLEGLRQAAALSKVWKRERVGSPLPDTVTTHDFWSKLIGPKIAEAILARASELEAEANGK